MKLVVIIPCLNEEKTIKRVIQNIPKSIPGVGGREIVVIDDGSTDKTAEIALSTGAEVFSHPKNLGVGAAFKKGIELALEKKADIAVNIDADGQFDSKLITQLVAPIVNDEADFVTCSRFKDKNIIPDMPKTKIWGNKKMAQLVSYLTGQKFFDVSCGFRAYSKEALFNLNLFGKFTYTQESFLDLAFKGVRVKEIPLPVRGEREYGKSRVANNLFSYGVKSLKIIIETVRDYRPLEFFGFVGMIFILFAIVLAAFLGAHWLNTGSFTPYKSFGFVSGFFAAIGLIIIVLALVADMLDRIRLNQEKLLYHEKKRKYETKE